MCYRGRLATLAVIASLASSGVTRTAWAQHAPSSQELISTSPTSTSSVISKLALTGEHYEAWEASQIGRDPVISRDGRYVAYSYRTPATGDVVVVETVDGRYKREFPKASRAHFTPDGRYAVFSSGDSTTVLAIKTNVVSRIPGREISPDGQWIVAAEKGQLTVTNAISGKSRSIVLRGRATFAPSSSALLVNSADSLVWIDFGNGNTPLRATTLQRKARVRMPVFNAKGTGVAFVAGDASERVIRYFAHGMDSARTVVHRASPGIASAFGIANVPPQFSADGTRLFFTLEAAPVKQDSVVRDSTVLTTGVNVWHYRDQYLQSEQKDGGYFGQATQWVATVPVAGGPVLQLEHGDSVVASSYHGRSSRYALIKNVRDDAERSWNPQRAPAFTLMTFADGRRTPIVAYPNVDVEITPPDLSPNGEFVVWYDPTREGVVSYEIQTGTTRHITAAMGPPLYDLHFRFKRDIWSVVGWLVNDAAVLISDGYDLWQVDPRNARTPINLTGGIGRRDRIGFVVWSDSPLNVAPLQPGAKIPLVALDQATKDNGFWTVQLGRAASAVKLSMDPVLTFWNGDPAAPIKATDANVYLVQRQTANDAPNWFVTTDLRSFRRLTDIQPQRSRNWMTAELITWKITDSLSSQGILYKPENFDAIKRYPVIFTYYERFSHELHLYRRPSAEGARLDIPWYVSNGYLVFIPDIQYVPGHTGQSALRSIESAARHLMQFPWVDSTKLGLQGHSFGGYETNYLVTHSTMFAAAQSGAGIADVISMYGQIGFGGRHHAMMYEAFQANLRTTPWERPDIYVENTPIFTADKVVTPLLLVHNKGDGAVDFGQAVELFTALRRLQKPSWLLEYDNEYHSIVDGRAQKDFVLRRRQFFEHYLRGQPAPVWMTQGIPAKEKGIRSGLEYDQP